ncbi:hypothetical protein TNCV_4646731 [Trichonephila clavipes]|uniref:Uncharacterized protein n=1 Tax=Trichonephila clavipes TaxID=2585209 RepID=A0A8X6ST31_TRICX|nr:hypothetical protein TNCV_4646731 [Trichonephila clavipes]
MMLTQIVRTIAGCRTIVGYDTRSRTIVYRANEGMAVVTEELFSYIGGLMGCWLGISVWASVGVFEKIYRKIVQVQQQLRKK